MSPIRSVEQPTSIRALAGSLDDEYPDLDWSHYSSRDQLLIVGQPGQSEPPAALRGVLATGHFEIRDEQVTGRTRWVAIVSPADERREEDL